MLVSIAVKYDRRRSNALSKTLHEVWDTVLNSSFYAHVWTLYLALHEDPTCGYLFGTEGLVIHTERLDLYEFMKPYHFSIQLVTKICS